MSIPNHATADLTGDFTQRFRTGYATDAYRTLGRTNLTVSKIGFGSYRCHQNNEIHFQALQSAIQNGCNVIDTSGNYTDGFAESLIGDVLNQEIVWGNLQRENLVLVSKVGYIQGENLEIAQKREQDQKSIPEVVKYGPGIWHCIHPYFIRDQITRTLARMHVDVLDIYLLHNPEYFLMDANKKALMHRQEISDEFYDRIYRAFLEMESLVAQGLIRFYGISANTFVAENDRDDFVSLSRVWQVYENVCSEKGNSTEEGHFAVIQFPFNWIEHQAFTLKNNAFDGKQYTVLELAQKLNLGVLVNRPLNAIQGNQMVRLAQYGAKEGLDYSQQFKEDLEKLLDIESRLIQVIDREKINVQINREVSLRQIFQNADTLRKISLQEIDVSQLNQMITHYFMPLFKIGEATLLKKFSSEIRRGEKEKLQKTKALVEGYFNQFNLTAKSLRDHLDDLNYQKLKPLKERFDESNDSWADQLTFSQKALSVAVNTPGVDVVLNGMRTPEYVGDAMEIMQIERIKMENLFNE